MWIINASLPSGLVTWPESDWPGSGQALTRVHLQVSDRYQTLYRADRCPLEDLNLDSAEVVIDQKGGVLLPCFVDSHTHLDKGHIWQRTPNITGTFAEAIAAITQDATQFWSEEDIYQRMDFALRCAYAHGTQAIRTHLDSSGEVGQRVWRVFRQIREAWRDRIHLEGVALVFPGYYHTPAGSVLVEVVAESEGILGGVFFADPALEADLDRLFHLAQDYGLSLDLHTDESGNVADQAVLAIAEAKQRHQFAGQVICGHCCSLSLQPEETRRHILENLKAAHIGVVSLPLCNLYLQDRQPQHTPQWRGVTALQELKSAGVAVALASDNCRDPFYAYGDHDGLEVLRESIRIGHLDTALDDWIHAVTTTPASWMGLEHCTQIAVGHPANFILCQGRTWNEVLSRPESDRRVFRQGQEIDTSLPAYAELDPLWEKFD